METKERKTLDQVPVLHVRGTHYEVGLAMGRTFKAIIQDFWSDWTFFTSSVLPKYSTPNGRQLYENTLSLCEKKFPNYVNELRGLADGSEVDFLKIFMLHIDSFMTAEADDLASQKVLSDSGCTSILCNNAEVILGQNEDAWPENVNRFYVVVAEVTNEDGAILEKFAALTHSGYLPGYSMGFNVHGLVQCVNTLVPKYRFPNGTPRWFLTRAVLGAENHEQVMQILTDHGSGTGDGFSLNMCYINASNSNASEMYSIEVAPPILTHEPNELLESQISVRIIAKGESFVHCNRYLQLQVPVIHEVLNSSIRRHAAIAKLPSPTTMELVKMALSDQSDSEYPVHRSRQSGGKDGAKTVATGIFNITQRKWFIYAKPAATSNPSAILSMDL